MQVGAKPERSFSTCSSSCLGTWEGRQVLGKPRLDQISGLRSGLSMQMGTDLQRVLKQCFLSTTDNSADTRRSLTQTLPISADTH